LLFFDVYLLFYFLSINDGWAGSANNFRGFGWVQKRWVGLGFKKSDPRPTLGQSKKTH